MKINAQVVEETFIKCMFKKEEIPSDGSLPTNAVVVDGIMGKYGFHQGRLELSRPLVQLWLNSLPHEFQEDIGGGCSFLAACNDEDGNQWTGLHQRMEQLFCLGVGLRIATCLLPREMWEILPGGMPYYSVKAVQ